MSFGGQGGTSGGRRRLPLLVAGVVGVVLVLLVRHFVTSGSGGKGAAGQGVVPGRASRTDCIPLNVTASSEKAALLSAIADDYDRSDRRVNGRCVDVRVTSMASGAAADALARGWDARVDGPRPDV